MSFRSLILLVLQFSGNTPLATVFSNRDGKRLAAVEQEIGCRGLNWTFRDVTDSGVVKAVPGLRRRVLAESSVVATVQITKVVLGEEGRSDLASTRPCSNSWDKKEGQKTELLPIPKEKQFWCTCSCAAFHFLRTAYMLCLLILTMLE